MPLYLLRVSLTHPTFRIPHLLSIAELFDFPIKFVSSDLYRGVLVVDLDNDEAVQHILDRGVMVLCADLCLSSCEPSNG